jgi:hypothetical protein
MSTINPEYLRMKAARLRELAKVHGDDPVGRKLWRLAQDMDTLALDRERRLAP